MIRVLRSEKLLHGAFLGISLLVGISYLFLEHSWGYRIITVVFGLLLAWEGIRSYSLHFAKLYALFLLACTALYILPKHFPLVTVGLLVMSFILVGLSREIEKQQFNVREIGSLAILFALVVVIGGNIGFGLFTKAAIAMVAVAGLSEMFRYPGIEKWRVALSYGILTLLLALLILTTTFLR